MGDAMISIDNSAGEWIEGKGYWKNILLRARDLNTEGTLVQRVRIDPKSVVAPHYHRSCTEVFHIVHGSGTMIIDDVEIYMVPGDTLTCTPGEIHATRNDSADTAFEYVVFKTNVVEDDSYWL
jgi:quercetin dioxygenase-like cupin family protein